MDRYPCWSMTPSWLKYGGRKYCPTCSRQSLPFHLWWHIRWWVTVTRPEPLFRFNKTLPENFSHIPHLGSCTMKEQWLACWSYCCTIRRPAKPWATRSSTWSTIATARSYVPSRRRLHRRNRPWPTAQSSSTWTSATWRPTSQSAASPFFAFSLAMPTSNNPTNINHE